MKYLFRQIYLASLLLFLCSGHSHATPIDVTFLSLSAVADDGIGPIAQDEPLFVAPSGFLTVEAVDGTASSSGSMDIVVEDGLATFDINVEQNFDLGKAADFGADLRFEIFEPMLYEITGVYSAVGSGGYLQFFTSSQLSQIATPQVNYHVESDNEAGLFLREANFTINGVGEGRLGSASGSPTGVLSPGRYFFSYFQGNRVVAGEPALASASGTASLRLTTVPLPAAAWLFGSALLGLGVIKRKRA